MSKSLSSIKTLDTNKINMTDSQIYKVKQIVNGNINTIHV
jgi:hypothetical protein